MEPGAYLPVVGGEDPAPEPTPTIMQEPAEEKVFKTIIGKMSSYWPPLGGPNCARFVNGKCLSSMASGEPWQDWVGKALACPSEFEFGTKFRLPDGSVWVCMDRGGKIIHTGRAYWLDLLTPSSNYKYGTEVEVEIIE